MFYFPFQVAVATEVAGIERAAVVVALVLVAAVEIVEGVPVAAATVVAGTVGVLLGEATVALLGQVHLVQVASHGVRLGQLNRAVVQSEAGFLAAVALEVTMVKTM